MSFVEITFKWMIFNNKKKRGGHYREALNGCLEHDGERYKNFTNHRMN